MKRVVWVAVTILLMIGIMGFALQYMKNISKVNQERREKEAAQQAVSQIVLVTETTNVYDKLRPQETSETFGDEMYAEGESETTEKPGVMHPASIGNDTTEASEVPDVSEAPSDENVPAPADETAAPELP